MKSALLTFMFFLIFLFTSCGKSNEPLTIFLDAASANGYLQTAISNAAAEINVEVSFEELSVTGENYENDRATLVAAFQTKFMSGNYDIIISQNSLPSFFDNIIKNPEKAIEQGVFCDFTKEIADSEIFNSPDIIRPALDGGKGVYFPILLTVPYFSYVANDITRNLFNDNIPQNFSDLLKIMEQNPNLNWSYVSFFNMYQFSEKPMINYSTQSIQIDDELILRILNLASKTDSEDKSFGLLGATGFHSENNSGFFLPNSRGNYSANPYIYACVSSGVKNRDAAFQLIESLYNLDKISPEKIADPIGTGSTMFYSVNKKRAENFEIYNSMNTPQQVDEIARNIDTIYFYGAEHELLGKSIISVLQKKSTPESELAVFKRAMDKLASE